METMELIICGEKQELTAQEVQEQLDSLFKENSELKKDLANVEDLKAKLDDVKKSSDYWWNSYKDEQNNNARIRKAIEAAKTVLEMC